MVKKDLVQKILALFTSPGVSYLEEGLPSLVGGSLSEVQQAVDEIVQTQPLQSQGLRFRFTTAGLNFYQLILEAAEPSG